MKKFFKKAMAVLMCLTMGCVLFSGCISEPQEEKNYVFSMPDGAPSLAVAALMKNYSKIGNANITYKIVAPDTIGQQIASKSSDIVLMPTNAAAKLFNKGVKLQLATVNVFGILYMVGREQISSLEDLKGKLVYNIGQGNTPDLVLKYILENNGIDYEESTERDATGQKVSLAYLADAASVTARLKNGEGDFGVLGQPVAANAINKLGFYMAVDLQAEWNKLTNCEGYPQAGVVVSEEVALDKKFMNSLYAALNSNYEFIHENPSEIKSILAEYESTLTFDFTKEVVEMCNIGCKKAIDAKGEIETYFNNAKLFDKQFIGGELPTDAFYYNY